jgi:hypothetical protein
MIFAVAALIGLTQFQSAPVDELQLSASLQPFAGPAITGRPFYYGPRINMNSPLSGSVLVAQAIRAGRVRIPYAFRPQPNPFALTCSPAPCTTPNVQASGGGSPVNETPIAVDPRQASHLLTGGNDYNCPNIQGFYASSNKGSTWNHTCLNSIAGTGGDGDPIVGYDLHHTAFIGGIDSPGSTSEIALEKSTNNGQTWSAPFVAITGIAPYTFVDKPWMQIDDTPTSPWPNWIYISSTEFDPSSNTIIAVGHSPDGGMTWQNEAVDSAVYPVVDQFSDLGIGADGTVYVTWMRCTANGPNNNCGGTRSMIMFSKSSDGGNTWTAPVLMAMANLAPDPCGQFYGCLPNTSERVSNIPAIDVDRSGGVFNNRLYASIYHWNGNKMQVLVVRSRNGGATWSAPVKVSPGGANDEFFPWLTTRANGEVGVTWLDRRLDPSNINYDSFTTISTTGGVSFGPAVRMSTVSSNPFNDGFGGSFMGDYTGNIWSSNTLFASWTDTRSLIAQDEIGGYKVP